MTVCIGIIDKEKHCCYVGADHGVKDYSCRLYTSTPKVFHPLGRTDIVVACSGSIRACNLLYSDPDIFNSIRYRDNEGLIRDLIKIFIPKLREYKNLLYGDDAENEFDLIIAIKDRMFYIQADLSLYEVDSVITIGSASETAYGAIRMAQLLSSKIEGIIPDAILICANYNYGISTYSTTLKTE